MQKIAKWSGLSSLPLPPQLINQIKSYLLEPFETEQQAESIWSELNCQLWFLCSDDQGPEDETTRNLLTHASDNVEWEELIGEDYKLTLSIICDDGQGLYLLFHKDQSPKELLK